MNLQELKNRLDFRKFLQIFNKENLPESDILSGNCPICFAEGQFTAFCKAQSMSCKECEWQGDAVAFLINFHKMTFEQSLDFIQKNCLKEE